MRKIAIALLTSICLHLQGVAPTSPLYPSMDLNFPTPLPKNFRIATDPYKGHCTKLPTREGLERLHASASGQFLTGGLYLMLFKLPQDKKIIILDLREESHGYVNSLPIAWRYANTTWTNLCKTTAEIEKDEETRLQQLLKDKKAVLDPNTRVQLPIQVNTVATEKEIVSRFNLGYVRIPITENHSPSPETVDALVNFIITLPDNAWVHVHCHGGRGRTTTFLVMYDILLNGKKVSLDDILLRQKLLGGTDILKPLDKQDYRHGALAERVQFIRKFYEYATKSDPAKIKFSDWLKKNAGHVHES